MIALVHHAEASSPYVDPQRPLTTVGREQAEWVAARVKDAGVVPAAIWHSGKLRGRQTAEICYRVCNPFAEFKMVRGLSPEDATGTMSNALLREARTLLVVGHRPHLPALFREMLPESAPFPTHGVVCVELDSDAKWKELWRAQPPRW